MDAAALPVLVLGADSPIGLTVVRELGARGAVVIAHGRSDRALGRFSRFARSFLLDKRSLGEWLPAYAAEQGLGAVMAVSEGHLVELAALKDSLACKVLTPDAERLGLVLDKARTFEAARGLGIAVPADWQPCAGEDFAARMAEVAYPVAIKWADPHAVQGALADAGIAFEKVEYADGPEQLARILARYDGLKVWPLVQQYCPGHGLGQMLHMADGKATLRFQHRRLREFPPTGGVSSFCASVPLDEHAVQMMKSEELLVALGWEGPAMVEYRFDSTTGTYWLMEINGRFWGSIPLAWHCGAHFAWETYRCGVLGERGMGEGPKRQRRARYVIPDAKRTVMVMRDRALPFGERLVALGRFFADFLDPRVRYYVWSLSDPGPFFGDMAGIVMRLWRRDSA